MPTLSKMLFEAYSSGDYSGSAVSQYSAQVNPNSIKQTRSLSYKQKPPSGAPNATPEFDNSGPYNLSFELLFDATGVVPLPGNSSNLEQQIQAFQDVVYTFNGKIHSPNYIKISWGRAIYKVRLVSLNFTYSLFRSNGTFLRAKAEVSFTQFISESDIQKGAGLQSPDLTHSVTVKAGDTLPALSQNIYGSTNYYLRVAKVNRLANFRQLKPGTVLEFPPLKPTSST
jgi:nucleoid-associated protein YgaU